MNVSTVADCSQRAGLTSKTTDTLSKKATTALASKVKTPTPQISVMLILGISQKRQTTPFMAAQAGAK